MKKIIAAASAFALTCAIAMPAFAADAPENGFIAPPVLKPESADSSYHIVIDGQKTDIDALILVPVRATAEALGFTVTWNGEKQSVNLDNGSMQTDLSIGQDKYLVYVSEDSGAIGMSAPFSLGAAPTVINGLTYVPVELFRVLLGNGENIVKLEDNAVSIQAKEETTEIPNPLTEHKTLDELTAAVGFEFALPSIPAGYQPILFQDINKSLAEIRFSKDGNSICYRVSKGSGENSGIYQKFESETTVSLDEVEVSLRGNSGLVELAVWEADSMSFSISFQTGVSEEVAQQMVASVLN